MANKGKKARLTLAASATAFSMLLGMTGGAAFAATSPTLPTSGVIIGGNFYGFNYMSAHLPTVQAAMGGSLSNIILDLNGKMANFGSFLSSNGTQSTTAFNIYASAHSYTPTGTLQVYSTNSGNFAYPASPSVSSVSATNVTTVAGTAPVLPTTVNATMSDGTTSSVAVTWGTVAPSKYAAAGTFTVTGTIANSSVTATATVTVTANASITAAAKSTVAGVPSGATLTAGASESITFTANDAAGNPVTGLASSDFALSMGGTAVPVTSVSASGTGNNVYTVNFTAPATETSTAAALTLVVGNSSYQIGSYTVVAGAVSPTKSTVSFSGTAPTSLATGQTYTLDVTAEDASGNVVSGLTQSNFNVTLGSSSTNLVTAVAAGSTAGTYTVTITAPSTANSTAAALNVSVSSIALTSPGSFTVMGVANATKSTVSGLTSTTLTDGTSFTLDVNLEDAYSNSVSGFANTTATLNLVGSKTQTLTAAAVTNGTTTGSYVLVFNPSTLSADSNVTGTLTFGGVTLNVANGMTIGSSATLGTPSVTFPSGSVLNAGGSYSITANLVDQFTNVYTGNVDATIKLGTGTSATTVATDTNIAESATTPGQYTFTFTAPTTLNTTAEPLVVSVAPHGTTASVSATSTASYTVAQQTPSAMTANFSQLPSTPLQGATYTIPVTVTDANGSPVSGLGSTAFAVSAASTGASANTITTNVVSVTASAGTQAGTYNVQFTAPVFATTNTGSDIATLTVGVSGFSGTNQTSSAITFGNAVASAAPSTSNSTVTWPSSTSLQAGQTYTITANLKDSNGTALVGIPTNGTYFTAMTGAGGLAYNATIAAGKYTVAAGSTAGQYVITFEPSTATTSAHALSFTVNGTTFTAPSTYSVAAGTAVASSVTPQVVFPTSLVPGQSYQLSIDGVTDGTNAVSNLTASNFSVQYGSTSPVSLPVTNVTASSTAGDYTLAFTAPSTLTGSQSIYVYLNGQTATLLTSTAAVPVDAVSAGNTTVAATAGANLTGTLPSTTYNNTNTTALTVTGANALNAGAYYAMDIAVEDSASAAVTGLSQNTFDVTLGSSTTNLVKYVAQTATPGTYTVVIQAPSTVNSNGESLAVNVAGVSLTTHNPSGTYTIQAGSISPTNSSVAYPTNTALQSGVQSTMTATVKDAAGNPITTGLTLADFTIKIGSNSATVGTVVNNNDGTYTIPFTPTTADSTGQAIQVQYSGTDIGAASAASYTVAAGAYGGAYATSTGNLALTGINSTAQSGVVSATGTYTITIQATDASGNPITYLPSPKTVYVTFTPVTADTLKDSAGTSISAGSTETFNSNGQLTMTYTVGALPTTTGDVITLLSASGGTTYDTITIQ